MLEESSDLVIGVVGEAFSGKYFTVFGAPLGLMMEDYEDELPIDLDMRGIFERVTQDLLLTAQDLDGKETRCKVFCRYGFI